MSSWEFLETGGFNQETRTPEPNARRPCRLPPGFRQENPALTAAHATTESLMFVTWLLQMRPDSVRDPSYAAMALVGARCTHT